MDAQQTDNMDYIKVKLVSDEMVSIKPVIWLRKSLSNGKY